MSNKKINTKIDDNDDEDAPNIATRVIGDYIYLFYEGSIESDFLHHIANTLMPYPSNKKLVMVMNSGGGDPFLCNSFYTFMSRMGLCKIIGIGQLSSAALAMCLDCKKHKMSVYIDPLCHVVLHRVKTTFINEQRYERIIKYNDSWVNTYEKLFDRINEDIISVLPKTLLRDYKAGQDVYLMGQDLIEYKVFKELKDGVLGKEQNV